MSKYIPYQSVQRESFQQIVRFHNSLKNGDRVRILVGGRPATALKSRIQKAIDAGEDIKIITEAEFQAALKSESDARAAKKKEPKSE